MATMWISQPKSGLSEALRMIEESQYLRKWHTYPANSNVKTSISEKIKNLVIGNRNATKCKEGMQKLNIQTWQGWLCENKLLTKSIHTFYPRDCQLVSYIKKKNYFNLNKLQCVNKPTHRKKLIKTKQCNSTPLT